jgi:hypothetical protein
MSGYSLDMPTRHSPDRCPGFLTDLILRCAARDERALGTLFDHVFPLVNSIVVDHSGSNRDDGLIVAVFRRLWEQASTYDPKSSEVVEWMTSHTRATLAEYFSLGALEQSVHVPLPGESWVESGSLTG